MMKSFKKYVAMILLGMANSSLIFASDGPISPAGQTEDFRDIDSVQKNHQIQQQIDTTTRSRSGSDASVKVEDASDDESTLDFDRTARSTGSGSNLNSLSSISTTYPLVDERQGDSSYIDNVNSDDSDNNNIQNRFDRYDINGKTKMFLGEWGPDDTSDSVKADLLKYYMTKEEYNKYRNNVLLLANKTLNPNRFNYSLTAGIVIVGAVLALIYWYNQPADNNVDEQDSNATEDSTDNDEQQ